MDTRCLPIVCQTARSVPDNQKARNPHGAVEKALSASIRQDPEHSPTDRKSESVQKVTAHFTVCVRFPCSGLRHSTRLRRRTHDSRWSVCGSGDPERPLSSCHDRATGHHCRDECDDCNQNGGLPPSDGSRSFCGGRDPIRRFRIPVGNLAHQVREVYAKFGLLGVHAFLQGGELPAKRVNVRVFAPAFKDGPCCRFGQRTWRCCASFWLIGLARLPQISGAKLLAPFKDSVWASCTTSGGTTRFPACLVEFPEVCRSGSVLNALSARGDQRECSALA